MISAPQTKITFKKMEGCPCQKEVTFQNRNKIATDKPLVMGFCFITGLYFRLTWPFTQICLKYFLAWGDTRCVTFSTPQTVPNFLLSTLAKKRKTTKMKIAASPHVSTRDDGGQSGGAVRGGARNGRVEGRGGKTEGAGLHRIRYLRIHVTIYTRPSVPSAPRPLFYLLSPLSHTHPPYSLRPPIPSSATAVEKKECGRSYFMAFIPFLSFHGICFLFITTNNCSFLAR